MDDDDDLSPEDLLFLDKVIAEHNGSSTVQQNPENTQYAQMIADCFDDDGSEAQMEHVECLRSKFKHSAFRTKQWDIIQTLSLNRDVCAVMATGYGKSLCFQFPAIYANKITLVISPLISLMQAQVMDLETAGISACLVGTAQRDPKILERIATGVFNIIYSSPEYLQGSNGDKLLSIIQGRLALVAIDEAHCVSQWGHDFRPDFRKLNVIRSKLPNIPILAVTATATENVRYDIINLLGLHTPRVIMTSFDRTNLEFVIQRKTSVLNDLVHLIKNVNGSVIVYVLKRKVAEDIADELRESGIVCEHYHAGLDIQQKTDVLEKFLKDQMKVIVATIAFGMGIDKKDVRCVIHYGASKNLETYYQEVGRAGRDGKAAKVITFFSPEDFELHDWFLEKEGKEKKLSAVIKNYLRSLAAKMRDFLYSTQCRRKTILEYFGETTILSPRPNCCDNCTIGLCSWKLTDLYEDVDDNGVYDFAVESKILLEAIKCLKRNNISTEKNLLKKFLIGKFDPRLRSVQRQHFYASGQMHSDQHWLALTEQLMQHDFVEMTPSTIAISLTTKAEQWLRNPVSLPLKAIGQMFEYFEKKRSTPLVVGLNKANRFTVTKAVTDLLRKDYVQSDELLKQILSHVRDSISAAKNVPDKDSIASMFELDKMVKAKPHNLDELRYASISTFNDEKLNKYGPTFVNAIAKFTNAELEMQNVLLNHPMPNARIENVVSPQILRLLKDRKTKDEILTLTNLTEVQLYADIQMLIETGQPVLKTDLAYISHIDFKIFRQCVSENVVNSASNITDDVLNEIQTKYFEKTSRQIDSAFTKLALVYHAVRFHLNGLCVPYVDCEENILVNAAELIVQERPETVNKTFTTDRQYPPLIRNYSSGSTFIDFLFGARCYHYDESQYEHEHEYDYDTDHEDYSHSGSVHSGESHDRSDAGSEAESNEESDQENSEQESDESVEGSVTEVSSGESGDESSEESSDGSSEESSDGSSDESSDGSSDSDSNYGNERGSYSRKRRRMNNPFM